MNVIVKSLIYFGICFITVLLIYLLFINKKFRKEYKEGKEQVEIYYLIKRFKLNMRLTKYKTIKLIVSILNSFIVAFTFTVIINLKVKYVYKLMIAFLIMFIMIYSLYEITGRILKRKELKNNDIK
jgi:ABC-type transport system involved in cytochrome c biogenesis permease component